MPVTLSSADLAALPDAARLLASPLDFETTDDWRREVNRRIRALVGADSIGFFLPGGDADLAFSEEHDLNAINEYADWTPPPVPSGAPMFRRVVSAGVSRIEENYEGRLDIYLRSAYFNEYAGPNRACDTLTAACALPGAEPLDFAFLQMWHDRWEGRSFGAREVALLQGLYPAFLAGVEAYRRWHAHRSALLRVLDSLGDAVQVRGVDGVELHRTPALTRMLAADGQAPRLTATMEAVAASVRRLLLASGGRVVTRRPPQGSAEVRTETARYLVRGCLYGGAGNASGPVVLVTLDRRTPVPFGSEELKARYGLTPAESRVAALLAHGRTNAEVARALVISPHTARRHTERVLSKLGVGSRAEVGLRVLR